MSLKQLIILLSMLSAFPALSTDMYLPALPLLQELWQQPLVMINLTLICFFITYCFCIVIYGPLSDRFGRRVILVTGLAVYAGGSVMCSFAQNVEWLIAGRIVQAAGAAASSSLSLAISKDLFGGRERERVMAYISVIMTLAPMLGPIIGGLVMTFAIWEMLFLIQAACGLGALLFAFRLRETLPAERRINLAKTLTSYIRLMANRRYLGLVAAMSLVGTPFFAYIAGSSNIYIIGFGYSEQVYGYFFAFNAVGYMLGTVTFARLRLVLSLNSIMILSFAGVALGGLIMLLAPHSSIWSLALPNFLCSLATGISRPPSTNLVLEQVDQEAGAASSFMMFCYFVAGALGMWLISLPWQDKISVISILSLLGGLVPLVYWLGNRHSLRLPGQS